MTLGKSLASLGLSCHLIFNGGRMRCFLSTLHPVPWSLEAPEGSGNVSPVLWSLTHAELPRSSPLAFVLLGQTPQSTRLLGQLRWGKEEQVAGDLA